MLGIGGKRIRPVLTLLSHELFGGQAENVLSQALAIEVFHNFTLMHDDIMDVAPLRRGQATVHEKWDTNVAILSGDGMMIQSYELLAKNQEAKFLPLFRTFNKTAWEVREGQAMDMQFEKRLDVTTEEYLEMIRLKTAALLGCALELGAIAADASEEDAKHIRLFGEHIGLSFQLRDDYLDAFGDPEKFGKQVGGDILANKKTYLLIRALETAEGDDLQQLQAWLAMENPNPVEKVAAVTQLYTELGIRKETEAKINQYFDQAFLSIDQLNLQAAQKEALGKFLSGLVDREV